jgi:molecular chaperone GrpE
MIDDSHANDMSTESQPGDTGDDVVYEDDAGAAAVQKLRNRIKALEKEKQEYLDGWQRMKADVVNRDRAAAEERTRVGDIVKERLLEDLLPVLDAFDAAFTGAAWEKVDSNWRIGVEYIHTQFKKVLEENGITSFGKVGEMFDPMRHDPSGDIEGTKFKPGQVAAVQRAGYELSGRILRPARVTIAK